MVLFNISNEGRGASIVLQLLIEAQQKSASTSIVSFETPANLECVNVILCELINKKGVSTLEHHSFSDHKA